MVPKRIEICGGIASGKTTLARLLEQNGYTAVYERFEDNPFLKDFYRDEKYDNAFETEIAFTLLHYNQIRLKQQDSLVVSDYSLLQDLSYGMANLSKEEQLVYQNIYDFLSSKMSSVDLIIYLKCSVDCLLKRIRERDRDMELTIGQEYLQKTIGALEQCIGKAEHVLVIDSEKMDFTGPDQMAVLKLISDAMG